MAWWFWFPFVIWCVLYFSITGEWHRFADAEPGKFALTVIGSILVTILFVPDARAALRRWRASQSRPHVYRPGDIGYSLYSPSLDRWVIEG